MPKPNVKITEKKKKSAERLPGWSSEGALLLLMLSEVLNEANRRWQDVRKAGSRSPAIILAFLVVYFAQRKTVSLRECSDMCRGFKKPFAGLIGRRHWITQSSLSDTLRGVSPEAAEEFCSWLLVEATPVAKWQGSELTAMRDTFGTPWQIFDLDPTVKSFRRRALPESPELPEPRRLTNDIAAAGHSGRKRGQLVCSRAVLQHAGTGVWLGNWVYKGNADGFETICKSAKHVKRWCERLEFDPGKAVIRFDGGVSGGIKGCREAGLHFVTRCTRYGVLTAPEVAAHLAKAEWMKVPDSLSGPKRSAAELGLLDLGEGAGVRVVATRMANAGSGAGTVIGGERYELFATSLDADAWPADELVALYYGRSAEENQFAREDAELKLDHPSCLKLPGFQIVTSIGLFVWNMRTFLGAELLGVDEAFVPPQQKREPVPAEPPADTSSPGAPPADISTKDGMVAVLNTMPVLLMLEQRGISGSWEWRSAEAALRCPNGVLLPLENKLRHRHGMQQARFRAPCGGCSDCPAHHREACTSSTKSKFRKEVCFPLSISSPLPSRTSAPEWSPPPLQQAGPLAVAGHHIHLAELRHAARKAFADADIRVQVPELRPQDPQWLAVNPARRQRRRFSFEERAARNALPKPATVHAEAPKNVRKLLGTRV